MKQNILYVAFIVFITSCVGQGGEGTRKSSSEKLNSSSTNEGGKVASSVRPDGAVRVNDLICGCRDGQPDTVGQGCASVCSSKPSTSESILYGSVTLSSEITSNSQLRNLKGWCENELFGSEFKKPGCVLEVFSSSFGTEQLPVTLNSDTFQANIEELAYDTMYMAKIIENKSGSNVSSNTFQIYRHDPNSTTSGNVLTVSPINMYTCISRSVETTASGLSFSNWAKTHYLFRDDSQPSALPAGTKTTICHNAGGAETNDSLVYPRLELVSNYINLWNNRDIRFSDLDNDGHPDINRIIAEEYYDLTGNSMNMTSVFSLVTWPNMPSISNVNAQNQNLGMIMKPYIKNANKAICPTQSDYKGNDPYLKVLKRIVGVDTEAVYMAESNPQVDSVTNNSITDIMLISESQLKKIWFYFDNNGNYKIPTEGNASSKTIKFNWPPNEDSRFALNSMYQVQYTVKRPTSSSGLSTFVAPHDNRIGCIPVSID